MFSGDTVQLLLHVIKSWQVIVITVAIVAYMFLVSYVARMYRRPHSVSKSKPKKSANKAAAAEAVQKGTSDSQDTNEALGLEEI